MAKGVFIQLFKLLLVIDLSSSWNINAIAPAVAVEGNLRPETQEKKSRPAYKNDPEKFFCPERCACSAQEKIIDCSSLGLNSVPKVPRRTSRL